MRRRRRRVDGDPASSQICRWFLSSSPGGFTTGPVTIVCRLLPALNMLSPPLIVDDCYDFIPLILASILACSIDLIGLLPLVYVPHSWTAPLAYTYLSSFPCVGNP